MALSLIAAEHVHSPRNAGRLPNATHVGVGGTPGEGPYVRIWFVIQDGTVVNASYECNGCPSSVASASIVTQLAIGRKVDALIHLSARDVLLLLGGLPEGKETYAGLAVSALSNPTPIEIQQ